MRPNFQIFLSLAVFSLHLGIFQQSQGQQISFSVDDGSAESSLAVGGGAQNIWLNAFQAPEAISLSTVSIAFGANSNFDPPVNGTPFTGYIWSDPNNDGNPFDAVVISSFTDVIQAIHTDTFIDFSIPAVEIAEGNHFFVGFQAPDFAVGRDTNSNSGKSYIFSDATSATMNPNDLGSALNAGEFSEFLLPGNALIRATGTIIGDGELPVLTINTGAIRSLRSTGVLMPSVQQQSVLSAAKTAIGDLNNRLFRARAYGNQRPNGGTSSDVPISRFLDFAARNQIDYRVAIGLRDEDRVSADTIEAAAANTKSSRAPKYGKRSFLPSVEKEAKHVIAAPISRDAKNPTGGKLIIDDKAPNRWEVFTEVDYGYYDQDNLSAASSGFTTDSYAATLGAEYQLTPWLLVGGAFSRVTSDTELTGDLGAVDLDGSLLSAYFTAFYEEFHFDLLYSYGNFDNDISRNTLLGSNAIGNTGSDSETIDINIGYTHQLTDQIRTGPFAGFNYTLGEIDGYTERGGGAANLVYGNDDFESMIARLGWQTSITEKIAVGRITTQFRAAFAHEFRPEASGTQVSLLNSPFALVGAGGVQSFGGMGATSVTDSPGSDWLELGAGFRIDLESNWNVSVDYTGQFGRNDASAHFIGARVGYEW